MPNPYTAQLESLNLNITTTNTTTTNQTTMPTPPRVLVIVGDRDTVNRPAQGERVARALQRSGFDVTTLHHPHGHAVPVQWDETWDAIQAWIEAGRRPTNNIETTPS